MAGKNKKKHEEEIILAYNSKRQKDNPPKKRRKIKERRKKVAKILLTLFKVIAIIGVFAGIGAFLFISPIFNITEIKVENASKISENTYIALSDIHIGDNIFRINEFKIKETINAESYVETVEIKRELPGTIVLTITERTPQYIIEKNGGLYMYIDQNGYYLEEATEKIDVPILRGITTNVETLKLGERISEEDLEKFNDLIKIIDGMKNNNIEAKISTIDISDDSNYILEFTSENKKVMLGDTSNLSTKMIWIKYFMENSKNEAGTIYLNTKNVYFSPKK